MSTWSKLIEHYKISDEEKKLSSSLVKEFVSNGYIKKTCKEMLSLSNGVIINFYEELLTHNQPESPVKNKKNSNWMCDYDFCFMNVRATGLNENETGTFITAAKLLPIIRANGIHLGPFTFYSFEASYAVKTVKSLAPIIVDKNLLEQGISGEMQLKAFVEACHLLDKVVGFDLEPHTTQLGITVIENPELYRWYKMNPEKTGLWENMTPDEMLEESFQVKILKEVKALIKHFLDRDNIDCLEFSTSESKEEFDRKEQVFRDIIYVLLLDGYTTVPSHAWSGVGVPEFVGYNHEHRYPIFKYLNGYGEDHSDYAFHILAPYKFYTNVTANKIPEKTEKIEKFQKGIDHYSSIFLKWRDEYNFDFIRYDSVDAIFNSVINNNYNLPTSDRPTPEVLKECIEKSKSNNKTYIGNFAERMGTNFEDYADIGYDLILGDDMLSKVNKSLVEKSFHLYERLVEKNKNSEKKSSISFCIDSHDTGDVHLWGDPLVKILDENSLKLRHFVSRFISVGYGRRPKYEVMGFQDRSYGLHMANVKDCNLHWQDDKEFNNFYHYLEDIYEKYKHILSNGEIIKKDISDYASWWMIKFKEEIIICALKHEEDHGPDTQSVFVDLKDVYSKDGSFDVKNYNFNNMTSVKIRTHSSAIRIGLVENNFALCYVK